jgi:hypothetical protein
MEKFKFDPWQETVLAREGHITIRSGRQVGKSTVIACKAARFARDHPGTVTLVIAASQRQSSLIFDKIKSEIEQSIQTGEVEYLEEPTLTRVMLKNGSKIYSLPAGRTGYFIRGFTIDLLICDEAAYIPEEVWRAVIPMVAVSQQERGFGWIILLSTPFGKGGYFYSSFQDPDFQQFHISSENCPRIPKAFLLKEKSRMSKAEYAQEYQGEFIDDFNQFFSTTLIKECMSFMEWNFERDFDPQNKRYYLGVDIARYGGDENAFAVAEMSKDNTIRIIKVLTTVRMSITDTIGRVLKLEEKFKFARIFVDDAGVGGGAMDLLLEKLGRKVVGLNNAKRSIDKNDTKRSILKEDLYSNALVLMESHKVQLINDLSFLKSLKSIMFEYTAEKNVRLFGDYSHLTEAYVRACWCIKDKGLRPYIM